MVFTGDAVFYECPLELNITGRFLSSAQAGLISPLKSVQIMFANQFGPGRLLLAAPAEACGRSG